MTRQPRGVLLWAAIRQSTSPLTSRNLAARTGIPMPIVSALLRRYADRGQLKAVGLGPRLAGGGLRATVYQLQEADQPVEPPAQKPPL
jgi:hypothetical protein